MTTCEICHKQLDDDDLEILDTFLSGQKCICNIVESIKKDRKNNRKVHDLLLQKLPEQYHADIKSIYREVFVDD